jgi:hypothetical protein
MINHLKYAIAGLALLASLGLGSPVRAENSAPQANVQTSAVVLLAWQRVGAPISMEG